MALLDKNKVEITAGQTGIAHIHGSIIPDHRVLVISVEEPWEWITVEMSEQVTVIDKGASGDRIELKYDKGRRYLLAITKTNPGFTVIQPSSTVAA